jgi:hypothetical protein
MIKVGQFDMIRVLLLVGAGMMATLTATAQNLLFNGNFEQGNVGFSSDYDNDKGNVFPDSTYAVLHNPREGNPYGADFPDHTTGKGYMLVANGSPDAHKDVWRETVHVEDHQQYVFSGWTSSWGMDWQLANTTTKGVDPCPSQIRITINGVDCGEVVQVPAANGVWLHFAVNWDSGDAIQARIEIRLLTTAADGNDMVLDDLEFGPASAELLPDGKIVEPDESSGGTKSPVINPLVIDPGPHIAL